MMQTRAPAKSSATAQGILQRSCGGACGGGPGSCTDCKKKSVQRHATSAAPAPASIPPAVHDVLQSPGTPLDAATRAQLEPKFAVVSPMHVSSSNSLAVGEANTPHEHEAETISNEMERRALSPSTAPPVDFSNVRIHTDANAAAAARAVQARAWTVGNHIAFDAGAYSPHTNAGQKLLAHELTHVLQQSEDS